MSEQVGESRFGEGVKNEATGSRFHVKPANVKLETVPLGIGCLSLISRILNIAENSTFCFFNYIKNIFKHSFPTLSPKIEKKVFPRKCFRKFHFFVISTKIDDK